MNAERDLTEAYQEWRRLAAAQGGAIDTGDWNQFSAGHHAIQRLQERISRLAPAVRQEWATPGCDLAARQAALNTTIHDLLGLVRHNQILLTSKREAVHLKLAQLGQAGRNLKQLRRSYGFHHPAGRTVFA